MKAQNPRTGTVHNAKSDTFFGVSGLVQTCGMSGVRKGGQLNFLEQVADDATVTCRKCSAAPAPAPKATPAPRTTAASSGPTVWGIFVGGSLQCHRDTKRAAQEAATRFDGAEVRKI